jgi:hypothetical protein
MKITKIPPTIDETRGDARGDEDGAGESENVIPDDSALDEEQLDELRAGEELKTHLRIFLDEVDELRSGITGMLEYEPGHRHLREAPRQVCNMRSAG